VRRLSLTLLLSTALLTPPLGLPAAQADTVAGPSSGIVVYAAKTPGSGVGAEIDQLDLATDTVTQLVAPVGAQSDETHDLGANWLVLSPSGTQLAYVERDEDTLNGRLFVRTLADGSTVDLGPVADGRAAWAPDGVKLYAYVYDPGPVLRLFDPTGATPTSDAPAGALEPVRLSPDGNLVEDGYLYDKTTNLTLFTGYRNENLDGRSDLALQPVRGRPTWVSQPLRGPAVDLGLPVWDGYNARGADWSPGRDAVIAAVGDSTSSTGELWVVNADGTAARQLAPGARVRSPVWLGARAPAPRPSPPVLGTAAATTTGPHSGTVTWPVLTQTSAIGVRVLWKAGGTPPGSLADADRVEEAVFDETTKTTAGLAPGLWSWSAQAFDGFGQTSAAQTGTVTAYKQLPSAVDVTSQFDTHQENVLVTWSMRGDDPEAYAATSWLVTRLPDHRTWTLDATHHGIRFTDLVPGTAYHVSITPQGPDGAGPVSTLARVLVSRPLAFPLTSDLRVTLNEGQSLVVAGQLQRFTTRAPIAGQRLVLYASAADGSSGYPTQVASAITNHQGRVSARVTPNGPMQYSWYFATSNQYTRVGSVVDVGAALVKVRYGLRVSISRSSRGRRTLMIVGPTNRAGQSVNIQVRGNIWSTVSTVRLDRHGRAAWVVPASIKQNWYLRVRILAVKGHPYSSSAPVQLP
jgi:hypothetical protein